jgi:hypothetical protein
MIDLSYSLDPRNADPRNAFSVDVDLSSATLGELHFYAFAGIQSFVIDGVNFGFPFEVSLFYFGMALVTVCDELNGGRDVSYLEDLESAHKITFERSDDRISIRATNTSEIGKCELVELSKAARRHLRTLLGDLIARYPKLSKNPILESDLLRNMLLEIG